MSTRQLILKVLKLPARAPRAPPPRRHTSRFMMIWLTLLPFALYASCGWATIPMAGIIGFLLLGERLARGSGRGSGRAGAGGRAKLAGRMAQAGRPRWKA